MAEVRESGGGERGSKASVQPLTFRLPTLGQQGEVEDVVSTSTSHWEHRGVSWAFIICHLQGLLLHPSQFMGTQNLGPCPPAAPYRFTTDYALGESPSPPAATTAREL